MGTSEDVRLIVLAGQGLYIRTVSQAKQNGGRVFCPMVPTDLRGVRGTVRIAFRVNMEVTSKVPGSYLYHRVRGLIGFFLFGRPRRFLFILCTRASGLVIKGRNALGDHTVITIHFTSKWSTFLGATMFRASVVVVVSAIRTCRFVSATNGNVEGFKASGAYNSYRRCFRGVVRFLFGVSFRGRAT